MKSLLTLLFLSLVSTAQSLDERIVIIPVEKPPQEAPLFYSVAAEVSAQAAVGSVLSDQKLTFTVLQGKPETLTIEIMGAGEILSVAGEELRDWSVRIDGGGKRFLDIRPVLIGNKGPAVLTVQLKTRLVLGTANASLLLPAPGPATGFSLAVSLLHDVTADLRVVNAVGLVPVDRKPGRHFLGYAAASLDFTILPGGTGSRGMEFLDVGIVGKIAEDEASATFRMTGTIRANDAGAAMEIISGGAALSDAASGDGWHVALRKSGDISVYDLIADRGGEIPINLEFVVGVTRRGDWRVLDFKLPAGVVVPVRLEGLGDGVSFDSAQPVVPQAAEAGWRGFLPANGSAVGQKKQETLNRAWQVAW